MTTPQQAIALDLIDILQYREKLQENLATAKERQSEVEEELHSSMERAKLDTYYYHGYTFTRAKGTVTITTDA